MWTFIKTGNRIKPQPTTPRPWRNGEKVESTMNKKLITAVKRNLGGDVKQQLKDITNHGISGGFGGFIYYSDTVKFFKNNRAEIIELVREMAQEFGQDPIEFVASFNCLKPADFETREEIARG